MSLNSKLFELYNAYWSALLDFGRSIGDPHPTAPLLLSVDEARISQADKIIMICGQETWGWNSFGSSIEDGMALYHRFFTNGEFYEGYGVSSFWKAFRFFKANLASVYSGQKLEFVWQNISKIGRNDEHTGVTDVIRLLERQYFPVFKEEMNLIQPDMILFLTGPDRDHDIQFHFPDAKFHQTGNENNLRRRAWVESSNLPRASLRLYHPSYYRAWTTSYKNEAVSLLEEKA